MIRSQRTRSKTAPPSSILQGFPRVAEDHDLVLAGDFTAHQDGDVVVDDEEDPGTCAACRRCRPRLLRDLRGDRQDHGEGRAHALARRDRELPTQGVDDGARD